jgi:hypothetical protein
MRFSHNFTAAFKAAGVHLLLSVAVALVAGAFVFTVWYPFPYRELMGGRELFFLVIAVDVVCGPLLTLVLYNPSKPRAELMRDLGLVAIIQFAALLYGLQIVMAVRPVYLVYEVDRFTAVSAIDVDDVALEKINAPWNSLPLWGARVIATREPKGEEEKLKSISESLIGSEPSVRPDWWKQFDAPVRANALRHAKPLKELRQRHFKNVDANIKIDTAIRNSGRGEDALRWLPLTSKRATDWVVLIDAQTAMPIAYVEVDGFAP